MDGDQAIPTIKDCDTFKACLHRIAPLLPDGSPMRIPSLSQSFNEVWRLYLQNKLEGTPQQHFNFEGIDPFQHLREKKTALPFFCSVVKRFGTTLNQVRVATRLRINTI